MANQLEEQMRVHKETVDREVVAALEFGLVGAIAHAGGVLTGFSVKIGDSDVLMTLRAVVAGRQQIAFVGCPDLPSCFRKAVTEAYHDGLRWREDAYQKPQN